MSDIKFRGLTNEGKWVYGVPVRRWWYGSGTMTILEDGETFGSDSSFIEVDEGTIGRYIGLENKNSIPIYGGDVVYIAGHGNCIVDDSGYDIWGAYKTGNSDDVEHIVGNIHQNPELKDE
jgi:hypothetical protein